MIAPAPTATFGNNRATESLRAMNRDDIKALMMMAMLMVVIFATGLLLNLWVVLWGVDVAGR
jgi:hypothetical protein